jgi:hypothetical protein
MPILRTRMFMDGPNVFQVTRCRLGTGLPTLIGTLKATENVLTGWVPSSCSFGLFEIVREGAISYGLVTQLVRR